MSDESGTFTFKTHLNNSVWVINNKIKHFVGSIDKNLSIYMYVNKIAKKWLRCPKPLTLASLFEPIFLGGLSLGPIEDNYNANGVCNLDT
jgi:hypothetical protein